MISDKPKRTLQHREPFLWVHRLIERQDDGRAGLVELDVPAELEVFKGHFPQNPVFPGVLQVEAAAQACLWVFKGELPEGTEQPGGFFAGIDSFKFKRTVVPPAVLQIHVKQLQQRGALQSWSAEIKSNGAVVSFGTFWLRFAFEGA